MLKSCQDIYFFFCWDTFTVISDYDLWVPRVCIPQLHTNKCLFLTDVLPSRSHYSPQLQIADQICRAYGIWVNECELFFIFSLWEAYFPFLCIFYFDVKISETKNWIWVKKSFFVKINQWNHIEKSLCCCCTRTGLTEKLIMYIHQHIENRSVEKCDQTLSLAKAISSYWLISHQYICPFIIGLAKLE